MERASCFSCSLLLSVGLVAILGVMEEHRCMPFVRLPFDMLTLYPPCSMFCSSTRLYGAQIALSNKSNNTSAVGKVDVPE